MPVKMSVDRVYIFLWITVQKSAEKYIDDNHNTCTSIISFTWKSRYIINLSLKLSSDVRNFKFASIFVTIFV